MKAKRYMKINAKGRQIYKFINHIHDSGLKCLGQYCKGDTFVCEIYGKDFEKLKTIAELYDIEIKSFEYATLESKILAYRKRIGIFLGVGLILIGAIYFNSIIMKIEIEGNERVTDEAILYALEDLGVKQGCFIKDIDYIYCENRLMVMVDGVSWAGMHRTGNRLVVEVTETVEAPDLFNSRIPCNVFSNREAKIVSVSVYDGMLMRIVGDYVMPNDLLISGVTSDDTGHTTLHHAMGSIIGIYNEEVKFSERVDSKKSMPTGETKTYSELKLFNFDIPLFIGRNDYDDSYFEIYENPVEIGGIILPISIIKNKVYELTETALSEDELKEEINKKIYLYEKNFLSEDVEILDRQFEWENNGETITCTVTYSLKGDICEQREILIK